VRERGREREGGTEITYLCSWLRSVGSLFRLNCLISRLVSFSVSREVLASRLGLVSV
jgi:hypothetical protein